MATIIIPTFDNPNFSESVSLDGLTYILTIRYNTRLQGWTLDIETANETVLVSGTRIVLNRNLLYGETDSRLPQGELFVIDPAGIQLTDPGRTAWAEDGENLALVYREAE